jgi:hypothetical protein
MALLTGAAAIPGVSVSQQPPESYRVVRPAGNGPHPVILFVSGCSGFTPHEARGHDPQAAAAAREEVRRFLAR